MSENNMQEFIALWQLNQGIVAAGAPCQEDEKKQSTTGMKKGKKGKAVTLKEFQLFPKLCNELQFMVWQEVLRGYGQIISIKNGGRDTLTQQGVPRRNLEVTYEHNFLLQLCPSSRDSVLKLFKLAFAENFKGTNMEGRVVYNHVGVDAVFFESVGLANEFLGVTFYPAMPGFSDGVQVLDVSRAIKPEAKFKYIAIRNTQSRFFNVTQQVFDHCGQPEHIVLARYGGRAPMDETNVALAVGAQNLKIKTKEELRNQAEGIVTSAQAAYDFPTIGSMTLKGLRLKMEIKDPKKSVPKTLKELALVQAEEVENEGKIEEAGKIEEVKSYDIVIINDEISQTPGAALPLNAYMITNDPITRGSVNEDLLATMALDKQM